MHVLQIFMLLAYIGYLVFQLKTHAHMFEAWEEDGEPQADDLEAVTGVANGVHPHHGPIAHGVPIKHANPMAPPPPGAGIALTEASRRDSTASGRSGRSRPSVARSQGPTFVYGVEVVRTCLFACTHC